MGNNEVVPPPPLDAQYEDILTFIIDQCYKFDKKCDGFITVPKCEKATKPVADLIFGHPLGLLWSNWRGEIQLNVRKCPACECLTYKTAMIGDLITCGNTNCAIQFWW